MANDIWISNSENICIVEIFVSVIKSISRTMAQSKIVKLVQKTFFYVYQPSSLSII